MVRRLTLLMLGTLLFALVVSGIAVAGYSPQDIYDDFAADGRLDRTYSDAELNAYLNDAQAHEYLDNSITDRLDDKVLDLLSRDTFPFTGFQLLMAGIVVVVLIGGGIALRRFSRPARPAEPPKES